MMWLAVGAVAAAGLVMWMNWGYAPVSPNSYQANPVTLKTLTLNTMTSSELGSYLVAANGMTLYLYTKDAAGVSNCYGACATNWPPYLVTASASLAGGTGIDGAVSTITRNDGTLQVAYKGVPLYFWRNDSTPGDTTGQNVGGVWFVVKP